MNKLFGTRKSEISIKELKEFVPILDKHLTKNFISLITPVEFIDNIDYEEDDVTENYSKCTKEELEYINLFNAIYNIWHHNFPYIKEINKSTYFRLHKYEDVYFTSENDCGLICFHINPKDIKTILKWK